MSSRATIVLVKFTSPGLSRPRRSSAALPSAMTLLAVAAISFVVVSNGGTVTTALNFSARFSNFLSEPVGMGFGLGTSAKADKVTVTIKMGMMSQRISREAKPAGGTFKRILKWHGRLAREFLVGQVLALVETHGRDARATIFYSKAAQDSRFHGKSSMARAGRCRHP